MNPKKIKYGTREYKEAYENNQVVNSYNGDTYEVSLPEVLITPRNNLDLGQVVRNGTSKVARPIIRVAETALAMGRIGAAASNYKKTGNKALLKKAMSSAAFEALPYINIKALKLPLSEADDIVKTITKEKFGITNLSKRIIEAYNKANEYRTTVGRELLNMTQSLFRNYKPVLATQ